MPKSCIHHQHNLSPVRQSSEMPEFDFEAIMLCVDNDDEGMKALTYLL